MLGGKKYKIHSTKKSVVPLRKGDKLVSRDWLDHLPNLSNPVRSWGHWGRGLTCGWLLQTDSFLRMTVWSPVGWELLHPASSKLGRVVFYNLTPKSVNIGHSWVSDVFPVGEAKAEKSHKHLCRKEKTLPMDKLGKGREAAMCYCRNHGLRVNFGVRFLWSCLMYMSHIYVICLGKLTSKESVSIDSWGRYFIVHANSNGCFGSERKASVALATLRL